MSKIEWTDITYNPVWGCLSKVCDYCYARKIAKRFGSDIAEKEGIDADSIVAFKPTELPSAWDKKFPRSPKKIFVGSMSDIAFWNDEWLEKLRDIIRIYPHHTWILLTKFPNVYWKPIFFDTAFKNSVWFGVSITGEKDLWRVHKLVEIPHENVKWVSYEPVLGEVSPSKDVWKDIDWIVLGAVSNYKERSRIEDFYNFVSSFEDKWKIFIKQIPSDGGVEKDIEKFPEILKLRNFPRAVSVV